MLHERANTWLAPGGGGFPPRRQTFTFSGKWKEGIIALSLTCVGQRSSELRTEAMGGWKSSATADLCFTAA